MPQITIDRNNIEEAIHIIADTIGSTTERVRDYIEYLIECHQLLQSEGDSFTLIYGEPQRYEETVTYRLKQLAEEFERMMEKMDYLMLQPLPDYVAPFEQIPYTKNLHPRKDYQQRPYWLRIRSNPYRRNYH